MSFSFPFPVLFCFFTLYSLLEQSSMPQAATPIFRPMTLNLLSAALTECEASYPYSHMPISLFALMTSSSTYQKVNLLSVHPYFSYCLIIWLIVYSCLRQKCESSLTPLGLLPSIFTWIPTMVDDTSEMSPPSVLSFPFSGAEFFSSTLYCNHLWIVFFFLLSPIFS